MRENEQEREREGMCERGPVRGSVRERCARDGGMQERECERWM